MQDKKHHDLLLNSKIHTINILNICIVKLKSNKQQSGNYICNMIYILINREPFNLMLGSIQENYTTINQFVDAWYLKIHKSIPTKTISGIFGACDDQINTNKRIEFLEEIIKQLNKPSKNKKS